MRDPPLPEPQSPDRDAIKAQIEAQLGEPYRRHDVATRQSHLDLIAAIERPDQVALRIDRSGEAEWTVTVCLADHVGALSVIAGLLSAYRVDIADADIFTITLPGASADERPAHPTRRGRGRPPRRPRRAPASPPARPERLLLDIFHVRTPAEAGWDAFEDELRTVVGELATEGLDVAREHVVERVSSAVREAEAPETQLLPAEIEVDIASDPDATVLRIDSPDAHGFLFEFTNALALLNANIVRAEIRTTHDEAHDSFWLTDAGTGRKITDPVQLRNLTAAAALIRQFTHLLPMAPNPAQALRQFSALTRQLLSNARWADDFADLESGTVLETLAELMGVSRFLWDDFLRIQHDNLFAVVVDAPALDNRKTRDALLDDLRTRQRDVETYEQRVQVMNDLKDREMFRIDLRHITRRADFESFAEELSELGDVVIGEAAELAHEALRPRLEGRTLPPWCICALGKFGGRDMGFASDVEMLFLYDDRSDGAPDGTSEEAAGSSYFEQFVRTLITTVRIHRQGIFEIDLKLRPWGHGGPLANSLRGFREYFSTGGDAQQFERMALVRLRPIAGDPGLCTAVTSARDAFVYSGAPMDLDNIRHLRERQVEELVESGTVNAKYSPGGVVDVEYFVQASQIVAGHDDETVRTPGTLDAIDRLERGGHLAPQIAGRANEAYAFLRRLIDALRVVRGNARDLAIPPDGSREFAYLARRLDHESGDALRAAIESQMANSRSLWQS
ncbi:MAG: ACT domain-containing protein [Dehalococcoidia bacterium]